VDQAGPVDHPTLRGASCRCAQLPHAWACANDQVVVIDSGGPVSPSHTIRHTSGAVWGALMLVWTVWIWWARSWWSSATSP
jgi:hypothetical protein